MKIKLALLILTLVFYSQAMPSLVYAQSYKYMDSSGNINFVDRMEEVPSQYRNQLPGMNPTPITDKKWQAKFIKEKARQEQIATKQKKLREREQQKKLKVEQSRQLKKFKQADAERRRNATTTNQSGAAAPQNNPNFKAPSQDMTEPGQPSLPSASQLDTIPEVKAQDSIDAEPAPELSEQNSSAVSNEPIQ